MEDFNKIADKQLKDMGITITQSKKGMASNPYVGILKTMSPKIKIAISLVVAFIFIGAGTTLYWIVELIKYLIG